MRKAITNDYNLRFTIAPPRHGKVAQWAVVLQVTDTSKDACRKRATTLVAAVGADGSRLYGPYHTRNSFKMPVYAGFFDHEDEAVEVQRRLNRRLIQLEIAELHRQLEML